VWDATKKFVDWSSETYGVVEVRSSHPHPASLKSHVHVGWPEGA